MEKPKPRKARRKSKMAAKAANARQEDGSEILSSDEDQEIDSTDDVKADCIKCKEECKNKAVECDLCNEWCHTKCAGMSKRDYDYISDNKNTTLCWVCNTCKAKKATKSTVKDESYWFKELKSSFNENKALTVENALLKQQIGSRNPQPYSEVLKIPQQQQITNSANLMGNKSNQKSNEILVIKPITKDVNPTETYSMIKNTINPVNLKVNVNNININRKGETVIKCSDKVSVEKLSKEIQDKLSDKVQVLEKPNRMCRMEFVTYKDKIDLAENETLTEDIIALNDLAYYNPEYKVRVVARHDVRKSKATMIVLDVDSTTKDLFQRNNNRIKIQSWLAVTIKKHVYVKTCLKCQGYGHSANECTRNVIYCKYCGGHHESRSCKQWDYRLCVNCQFRNNMNGMKLDTNHYAHSQHCSVYNQVKSTVEAKFE